MQENSSKEKSDKEIQARVYQSLQESAEVQKFLARSFKRSPRSPRFTKVQPYTKTPAKSPRVKPVGLEEDPAYLAAMASLTK
jgi:hypothetical protein